jgi:predicted TPR repeat methyltransferase
MTNHRLQVGIIAIGAFRNFQGLIVGCGTGNYLDALKGTIGLLTGIDGSQEMLLRASQKCAGHSNIALERGSCDLKD